MASAVRARFDDKVGEFLLLYDPEETLQRFLQTDLDQDWSWHFANRYGVGIWGAGV